MSLDDRHAFVYCVKTGQGHVMVKNEIEKFDEKELREKIYNIRGFQVMLDSDLAELYGVGTKVLNQAVKRNIVRFPEEFCFMLEKDELEELRSQIVTAIKAENSFFQTLFYSFLQLYFRSFRAEISVVYCF